MRLANNEKELTGLSRCSRISRWSRRSGWSFWSGLPRWCILSFWSRFARSSVVSGWSRRSGRSLGSLWALLARRWGDWFARSLWWASRVSWHAWRSRLSRLAGFTGRPNGSHRSGQATAVALVVVGAPSGPVGSTRQFFDRVHAGPHVFGGSLQNSEYSKQFISESSVQPTLHMVSSECICERTWWT